MGAVTGAVGTLTGAVGAVTGAVGAETGAVGAVAEAVLSLGVQTLHQWYKMVWLIYSTRAIVKIAVS